MSNPTYDVGDHPKLSDAAKALDEELFHSEVRIAELELGLDGTRFSGDDEEDAKLAIILRVNRNVAADEGDEDTMTFLKREKRGGFEREFEETAEVRSRGSAPVATREEEIAARLLAKSGTGWAVLPTVR